MQLAVRDSATALSAARGASGLFAHPAVSVVVVEPSGDHASAAALAELRLWADRHDLAFVVVDDLQSASELSADGVEIAWSSEGYAFARGQIGKERTVGCRAGLSRHDAMLAGEAGADYVAFGGRIESVERFHQLTEMTSWWAEIFEIASLAIGARTPAEAASLAASGADFVAVPADIWGAAPDSILDLAGELMRQGR